MKKKLITIIMALALVLTLTPMVYALADSGGTGGDGGAGDGTPNLTTQAVATEQAVIQVGSATVGEQGTMGATGTVNVKVVMPENESLNGVGSFTVELGFDNTKLQVVSEGTEIPEIHLDSSNGKTAAVVTNLKDGDEEFSVTAANTDGKVNSNLKSDDQAGAEQKENRLQLSGATVLDVTFKAKDGVTLSVNKEHTFTLTECQVTKHVDSVEGSAETGGSTTYLMQLGDNGEHPATLYKAIATNTVKVVAGFSVSGSVESYNPGNVTTIKLYANTDTSHTNALHTGTIEATTGSGKKTQNFTIPTVQAGTYDIVVSKLCHLDYTIKGVEVNNDLNLTASTNDAVKMITLLCGDIDGNKSINFADYEKLLNPTNYDKDTTDDGVESKADLDGNGKINFADYEILLNPTNYDKKEVSVEYSA